MTTHVFIVDSQTFKVHLEYLFAGTGAKDYAIDFNNSNNSDLHYTTENMLTAMSADAGRIRRGDKILFYLQQNFSDKITEGKFYGIFEATENWSFLDNNNTRQYLKNELDKNLTYRTLLSPDSVYAEGVTEWEALDDISRIHAPQQMLWSLIYRKLKGNRGNTMVTIYESERLCQLIRDKNLRSPIVIGDNQLSFDKESQRIVLNNNQPVAYTGCQEEINFLPRLITKYNEGKAFEAHLQSYIVKNIGLGQNTSLDNSILGGDFGAIEWLGNEVSCGVGMQRIDIAISLNQNGQRKFLPIELKAVEANLDNIRQVSRYIDWIEQYYTPNLPSDILPIVVAKEFSDKTNPKYIEIIQSFKDFNTRNTARCGSIKYVEYKIENNNLIFNEITY